MISKANSLEQKQSYLRSQIIDAGVDPEPFMVFMGTVKGEGENINLQKWTLPQLKKTVQQFKATLQQELKREEIQMSKLTGQEAAINYRSSRQVAGRVMGSNLPKKQKVFYEKDDLWDFQLRTKQQCKKTHHFFDFKQYPQVYCKGIQVKKTGGIIFGIGAKNYIQIVLAPNFSSNSVARKSEDVDWLRAVLVAQFPGSYVPPLQQTPVQQYDKALVAKRSKDVLNFLNSLVHYDHLVNNKFTHMFLTQSDQKAFQNFKSRSITTPVSNNIKEVSNLQGYFPLQISQRIQEFIKNSQKYSKQTKQIYRAVQQTLNKVQNDLNSIVRNFHLLSKDLTKLHEKYTSFSQKSKFSQSEFNIGFDKQMMAMLSYLKDLFLTLQSQLKKQSFFVKDINQEHVKVMIKQWNQFGNFQNYYKRELDAYLSLRSSFSRKKQQFFLDLSKKQLQQRQRTGAANQTTLAQKQQIYKIKFSNQNKLQEDRRSWQGYLNYMYQKSFTLLLNEQYKQIENKLTKIFAMNAKLLYERYQKFNSFQKYMDQQVKKLEISHHS